MTDYGKVDILWLDGGWSWVPNAKYKSGKEAVHMLVDIVAKGGNLLFNIAPGPDGTWHDGAYKLLKEMGSWMDVNAEAIYETRAIAPYKEAKICYTNKKNTNTVYAIYLAEKSELKMPSEIMIYAFQPEDGSEIELLGFGKVEWKKSGTGTLVNIPERAQNTPPGKYAWTIKISEIKK